MEITLRRFCKLYTIVLIFVIVEATDSNSNDTAPEQRQSRVTGRIVKLYSGTRPEPILCAGEGFQADPHDCSVFYRCMKSGNGKYTVFRFQCGPGTVYDPETEICNHPRSTKRSECGGLSPPPVVDRLNNNEIEGALNEIPSPITNKPIRLESTTGAKTTFTTVNPWTASSSTIQAHTSTKRDIPEVSMVFTSPFPWGSTMGHTNVHYSVNPLNLPQSVVTNHQEQTMVSKTTSPPTTSISKSNSRDNICTSDGFMGDSDNCRKFYRCVANQRGTYTRFEFSCSESTVWDDDTQSCNHAWAVKRSRCGRSNQDNVITTNADIPQKDSSTDKTIQQQLQISFGSKVTQTQTQISNGSVIQNQTQINFGDRLNQNKDTTKNKQNQTQISYGSAVSQTQTQIDYSDKGVQTQLQIDHSQQASQTQIQVHESTTAGSTATAVSSTSHSGTQGGNNCVRSGFMGDTNDCKKFYRCIDNGRGGYTKFEFSCGEGTVWDQTIEACNHAWAVKDCGGKGSAATASTTQAAISTSQSTQNYYTTVVTENHQTTSETLNTEDNDSGYGQQNPNPTTSSSTPKTSTTWSSSTMSSTTIKSPSDGTCQSSGFVGDANDCKIFYRCVENGRGGFTKYEFKCGEGTVWDPDLEACNHAWAVKRCGGSASPGIINAETTTEQQNTVSTAHTQSTVITQSTAESVATQNDDYDTGYGSANNDFSTSTTTTKKPQNLEPSGNTICTSSGFMGDENDCKKFYRCVDNGNGGYTRYEFSCGEGTVWDSNIEACNHAWAVKKCGGSSISHQESTTQAQPTTSHEAIDSSSTEGDLITTSSSRQPSFMPSTSTAIESVTTVFVATNDCTKSGFMGDQKDCKKFYRCVDNGKGSFTKYEFSCGEGTVWDPKIEACNHAWAVKKCGGTADSTTSHHETTTQYHPTLNDEIDNGYPSNIETESDITTQSSTTHAITTESSKVPSESNNCINSGFIGDKNDCKKFYRCVDDGNGKYIRYEFSCGEGTLWDQSIEACNHAWAVKDCGNTGDNTAHTSSEKPIQSTLTTETEDQGYPQSTEKTSTSTVNSYPDSEPSEKCSKEGFMGDRKNCKKFYRCVDNGQGGFIKYEFTCGEGTYWSQDILACDHATTDKTCGGNESGSSTQVSQPEHDEIYTEATSMSSSSTIGYENDQQTQRPPTSSGTCSHEGFYGDPNDCKKFYRCVDNGKGGYTKYDFTCGDGTVWDQEIQACDHESSSKKCSTGSPPIAQTTENQPDVGTDSTTTSQIQHTTESTENSSTPSSSTNQCTSEGFFAVPNDCKKFIRCVGNNKGGFTKYDFSCGEGTIWVQDLQACDHDTGDGNCSYQTTSKPITTEGHQQTTENNDVNTSSSAPAIPDKQEDEYDNGNSNKPVQSGSGVCSSEGFYGNENDCRQFYRCVDNGQGEFTKYDFTCGEGTAWDSEIQACNHIDQVESCRGGSGTHPVMHDDDSSPTTESSSTTSPGTTSSGTTASGTTASGTTASETTASGTTTSGTTLSSSTTSGSSQGTTPSNKDTCDTEGYFGNSQDCKKFYRCVDNGKGGYTKYDFDCGEGTIWDQDITTCNHPQDVVNPSCNQNQDGGTTSPASSSSSSSESSSTTEVSSSGDSSSSTSSSSQSTTESTQGSSNCSQEDTSKKPANQNITCEKAGYYANPNDCKKFYRCVDWDGDGKRFSVYHFDCGEGTIWDPAVETCNHEESVYPPRDCSGSQSQSENQPPATEGTTTTQQTTSTTQSTIDQTTQSTTSEPMTTQQSTSTQKTTTQQSPTSEQTTTQQSTTSKQTTTQQTTTSEQTTTQSSTTSEQTTQQSTTSEQTTQSTTSEQTTQQPSSSEQTTTQQSTTSERTTTQQSTTPEQTTTQQSTTSEQTTTVQSTTSEQTTTQQSTTAQQTTTEQSTTSEQTTTEQSTTSEQTTTQQSTTSEQTTQESTTSEQTTEASPTTEQSTTSEQSTTEQSTSTTESSTTEQITTQQSTTTEQSEQSTTEETTNGAGTTTEQSTTQQSTTEQTNESSTTESSTNENTSESKCPETDENQSLFVCPTSFKRHPKYCNLFYQCDEDDDTHDVKIAVFTCPNNTIYDENQTRCVEESKADEKCDGKIAQKRRFKRLDRYYKEPLVVTKEIHACSSAGYFSFEKDTECSPAFLKCKTDKSNKIRGFVYQCPSGYVYWSISKRCEPIDRVRDCKRSQNNWNGRWEIPVERRNVAPS